MFLLKVLLYINDLLLLIALVTSKIKKLMLFILFFIKEKIIIILIIKVNVMVNELVLLLQIQILA